MLDLYFNSRIVNAERICCRYDVDPAIRSGRRYPLHVVSHRLEQRRDTIVKIVGS